jgi:hypothetical protein
MAAAAFVIAIVSAAAAVALAASRFPETLRARPSPPCVLSE